MELEGQIYSFWGTAALQSYVLPTVTLLVPVCLFANVSHTVWLEVKKKKELKLYGTKFTHSDNRSVSAI